MSVSYRQNRGREIGATSMLVNFLLFVGKFLAGLISNSIAIIADSFNNLADCGTSLATVIGFKISAKKADRLHPFGHGRMEYVAGVAVSVVIFITAYSVGEAAVWRIISPEQVVFAWLPAAICVAAIVAKIGLVIYVNKANQKINSKTLEANAVDSLTDTSATLIALLSLILSPLVDWPIDGYLGVLVALFIAAAATSALVSNIKLILGQGLSKQDGRKIYRLILDFDIFKKVERLQLHDYGPESQVLIVKVLPAVNPGGEAFERQLLAAKNRLMAEFGFEEVIIYWSPVDRKRAA